MKIVTFLNQKGGVGKTSLTYHLSGAFAARGRKVLLIDNDPQSSLTQGFWGPRAFRAVDPGETVAAIYRGDQPFPAAVIRPSGVTGLDLVAGSKAAVKFNDPEPSQSAPDLQACLRTFLGDVEGYDMVLIDCPPNLHLCSWAALIASQYLVVPTQPEDFGSQGLHDVQESAESVQSGPNPGLQLLGYVLTRVSKKSVHALYEENLRSRYGSEVFAARMPDAAGYIESIAARLPVAQHKPKQAPAKAIAEIADELEARIDHLTSQAITRRAEVA